MPESMSNTQTNEEMCALSSCCLVVKEGKSGKKQVRKVDCKVCARSFHAYCCDYHGKTDKEFSEFCNMFCCRKCYNFIDAVTENITFKMDNIMKNIVNQIKEAVCNMKPQFTCACKNKTTELCH